MRVRRSRFTTDDILFMWLAGLLGLMIAGTIAVLILRDYHDNVARLACLEAGHLWSVSKEGEPSCVSPSAP